MDQEYYEGADYEEVDQYGEEGEEGEEIEIEAIGVDVSSQPIELYKVFKIANLVGGGGEAKHVISEGYVAVNGELETRKRRKMYDGDFFEFNQEYYVVCCDQPVQEVVEKPKKKEEPKQQTKSKRGGKSKGKTASQNQNSGHNLSASAEPRKQKNQTAGNKAKANKGKAAANKADKPKPQRDEKSGRNSIDFF